MTGISVLDGKPSRVLSFPLTVSQQVWLTFLLPSFLEALIYIVDIATDIAIVCELLKEGLLIPGLLSFLFLYLPPLIIFFIRLTMPPEPKTFKVIFIWIIVEIAALILFPLRPIQCFAQRILWAIEAVRHEDPEREKALIEFEETRVMTIESYLFFQGYVHAGPQIILQIVLLVWHVSPNANTNTMQALSVLTSLATLALITANYQRYETQCQGGRKRVLGPSKLPNDTPDSGDLLSDGQLALPVRRRWAKAMEEDNPIGKAVAFSFWVLLLLGRCVSIIVAASFFPWAVLGVLIAHYLFSLLYILPSPNCKTSVPIKILLAFVYIFALVEVGVQFRKAYLLYALFFVFSFTENFVLTIVWVLWADWSGWGYHYALFLLVITHAFGILILLLYVKYFKPKTRRIQPGRS